MTDLRAAAQQAMEALEGCVKALDALHAPGDSIYTRASDSADRAEIALRAALGQPSPVFQDHSIPLGRRTQEQPIQPVAWIQPDHLQKARVAPFLSRVEPTKRMSDFVPIFTHPPRREPEPPPEPLSAAKIRAEFLDIDRHTLPGDMTIEDWFEAGVRYAERQHEIV